MTSILRPATDESRLYPYGWIESTGVQAVYQLSPDVSSTAYLYAASDIGLVVIDVNTEEEYARALNNNTTSVWNDENNIYVGTSISGIYYLEKDYITTLTGGDLTDYLLPWKQYPFLSSNNVKYLHGSGDYLCATTSAGVDFIWISLNDRDFNLITNAHKCFVCSDGKTYFTTSGTPNKIYRSNVPLGVKYPPIEYTCGSGYLENVPNVTDIYVTERTSSVETVLWPENTLFIAASGSAFIFDEGTKEIVEYRIGGPT